MSQRPQVPSRASGPPADALDARKVAEPRHSSLAAALAAAQANMRNPGKDLANAHLRSRYTSLSALRDAVLPALSAEGVALVQSVDAGQDGGQGVVTVSTSLLWGSERMDCGSATVPVSAGKGTTYIQALGSMVTYLRKYQLSAATGIASTDADDDDGNAGGSTRGPTRTPPPRRQAPRQAPPPQAPTPPARLAGPTLASLQAEFKAILKARGIDKAAAAATIAGRFDGATIADIWTNPNAMADLVGLYDNDTEQT